MRVGLIGVSVLVAATVITACSPDDGDTPAPHPPAPPAIADTYSNILREDYVGPNRCGECHKKNHANWKLHPHSGMNRMANGESVLGDFSGTILSYGDGKVVFGKTDGTFPLE